MEPNETMNLEEQEAMAQLEREADATDAAVELHKQILYNYRMAAHHLVDAARALKQMRDSKAYLSLGMESFEQCRDRQNAVLRAGNSKNESGGVQGMSDNVNTKNWQEQSNVRSTQDRYAELIQKDDPVTHPSHYTDGKIEVIDYIEDKGLGFHLGNAIKYISRAGKKDPSKTMEDLQKAIWYLQREIRRLESKEN